MEEGAQLYPCTQKEAAIVYKVFVFMKKDSVAVFFGYPGLRYILEKEDS